MIRIHKNSEDIGTGVLARDGWSMITLEARCCFLCFQVTCSRRNLRCKYEQQMSRKLLRRIKIESKETKRCI